MSAFLVREVERNNSKVITKAHVIMDGIRDHVIGGKIAPSTQKSFVGFQLENDAHVARNTSRCIVALALKNELRARAHSGHHIDLKVTSFAHCVFVKDKHRKSLALAVVI